MGHRFVPLWPGGLCAICTRTKAWHEEAERRDAEYEARRNRLVREAAASDPGEANEPPLCRHGLYTGHAPSCPPPDWYRA